MIADLPFYGALWNLPGAAAIALLIAAVLVAGFRGAALWVWTTGTVLALWLTAAPIALWIVATPILAVLQFAPLRRKLLSDRIFAFVQAKNILPPISETERVAIEAGDIWVDRDLFSGAPNLHHLSNVPWPELAPDEQAFLDGPVEEVCRMTDDWSVYCERDLPPEVWTFLKEQRFFGMIVPKEHGGLGFSAAANSAVVQKLASRSLPLAITVMVPNSLGPAELLIHFGTEEQKQHYLPRLACGDDIPCFALTEPGAGSDAAAMTASGTVFRNDAGEVCVRLNWDKRYITLAAVSTVLGLAFKLRDPEEILGRGTDLGITCALIPCDTPGVVLGRRHDPLGVPFYNCPTKGADVIVPISAVIGGERGAGQGWRMLMECLAAGRGISLPATSTGGAKLVARVASAHAAVRKQFGLAIGRFEGIEEPLARIAGLTYLMDAARQFTLGGLDQGAKPPVVTAMMKYQTTELFRTIINDGMDVLGGSAISQGPNNTLANPYTGAPISITVEGANILTRTLMVFGQGAIRCHPWALREIEALTSGDRAAFDRALWGHLGHVTRNVFRAVVLNVTRGRVALSPVSGPTAPYWRRLSWTSATFALWADAAMGTLGGDLKRKEKLTGRFADAFSWMYLIAATLRRYLAEGQRSEDLAHMRWAVEYGFARIQEAFDGLHANLPLPGITWLVRGPLAAWNRVNRVGSMPTDRLGGRVARAVQTPGEARDRLTAGAFLDLETIDRGVGRLDHALGLATAVEPIHKRIKDAMRAGKLERGRPEQVLDAAVEAGVITADEVERIRTAEVARTAATSVDSFTLEEYRNARDLATAATAVDAEGVPSS